MIGFLRVVPLLFTLMVRVMFPGAICLPNWVWYHVYTSEFRIPFLLWCMSLMSGKVIVFCVTYTILFCCYLKSQWFNCTAWEPFRDFIPENERECFITAYQKRLESDNLETQVSLVYIDGILHLYFSCTHSLVLT